MSYYLAIDIGAGSGRHMLGHIQNGKLVLEEIYRFQNGAVKRDGALVWDTERLFTEILEGLRRCAFAGKIPKTVAIDTWGVDYVLLNREKQELFPVFAYRDSRNEAAVSKVESVLSREELYSRTGIQKQSFNTIYQLWCDKESGKLADAAYFLMLPEYLAYRLCGQMASEYTIASTTGLLHAEKKDWDRELLDCLGYPSDLFHKPVMPPFPLGPFTPEIEKQVGFSAQVILCPTHDTASAVAACPLKEGTMYISSGTWSLAGIESPVPITGANAFLHNFTNEGGIEGRYRFLKNIMGMWPVQCIREETGSRYSYSELAAMAEESSFSGTFHVEAPELTAPDSMMTAIRSLLKSPELPLPDMLAAVYHSLALSYRDTANELEAITGTKITDIQIVGGGGAAGYLNKMTAVLSGRRVLTGLTEATATGNLLSQFLYDGLYPDLSACRRLIQNSVTVKEVQP